MCGIVGKYYFKTANYDSSDLNHMMEAIHHRGPDDSGTFCDDRVALGFRRLSIIDTEGGHQPLYNESGSIVLMANGEIYNYRELRKELESGGHEFSTNSDSEVILHLYEDFGEKLFEHLNGMYAFCLYDKEKKIALVARDRLGIKPMYLAEMDDLLIFSSEIKGILKAAEFTPCKAPGVLKEYLQYRYLAGDRTFFAGIKKLLPGRYIKLSRDGLEELVHWQPSNKHADVSSKQLISDISEAVENAVETQLVSDVPLGTLLSGGVDSGMVSAIAASQQGGLHAFTVGFDEAEFNEADAAAIIAKQNGMRHHVKKFSPREFSENLEKVIWFHDEPLAHANSVQIYLICSYAAEHVKVLLTGEGADELFGGYPRYYIAKFGENISELPVFMQRLTKEIVRTIPNRKAKKLLAALGFNAEQLVYENSAFVRPSQLQGLLDEADLIIPQRKELLESMWDADYGILDNLLMFEQQSYMQPILLRQDKMSMAASIESRVPMLDNNVVDLAMSIPGNKQVIRFEPKYLLKKASLKVLPKKIVYARKQGFGVPLCDWLRDDPMLSEYLYALLDFDWQSEGVNKIVLERLVQEHKLEYHDHSDILWPLINYMLWSNLFFCSS